MANDVESLTIDSTDFNGCLSHEQGGVVHASGETILAVSNTKFRDCEGHNFQFSKTQTETRHVVIRRDPNFGPQHTRNVMALSPSPTSTPTSTFFQVEYMAEDLCLTFTLIMDEVAAGNGHTGGWTGASVYVFDDALYQDEEVYGCKTSCKEADDT